MISEDKMDKKYKRVTFGMDGTHCPIWVKAKESKKEWWSYKKRNWGYNVLVD